MNTNKEFGHFGQIRLGVLNTEDYPNVIHMEVPLLILRKAPLKYHQPVEDQQDKDKTDAVYAFMRGKWIHVGNFEVQEVAPGGEWVVTNLMRDAVLALAKPL